MHVLIGGNTMPNYMRRKIIIYLIGIFTLAIGSNLFLNAALGVAPSCSLALTLTFLLPGSYALFNFIVNSLILILEAFIVRKFGKTQILQFIITFIYSYLIKITSIFLTHIQPHSFLDQILLAILACIVMALGITLTIHSNLTVMPYEGFIGALSIRLRKDFGKLRVVIDVLFTLASIVISLVLLHNMNSVGLGTIIASFLTGSVVSLYDIILNKKLNTYLGMAVLN